MTVEQAKELPVGTTVLFRAKLRLERNYSKFLRPERLRDTVIPFVVGVTPPEWLEHEMNRRRYHPMVDTRFDPARLPQ